MNFNEIFSIEEEAKLAEKCLILVHDSLKKHLSGRELNYGLLNIFIGCLAITMASVFSKDKYDESMKEVGIEIKKFLDKVKEEP